MSRTAHSPWTERPPTSTRRRTCARRLKGCWTRPRSGAREVRAGTCTATSANGSPGRPEPVGIRRVHLQSRRAPAGGASPRVSVHPGILPGPQAASRPDRQARQGLRRLAVRQVRGKPSSTKPGKTPGARSHPARRGPTRTGARRAVSTTSATRTSDRGQLAAFLWLIVSHDEAPCPARAIREET